MRLTSENSIHAVRDLLQTQVGREIDDAFLAQSVRLAGSLLNICARSMDDATELRVEENAAIRSVLGDVATIAEGDLRQRLLEASQSSDPGLKVSVLDRENNQLRHRLIDAQIYLESCADAPAYALSQRIWGLLDTIEAMRAPREQG